jgi:hypothetical protein
LKTLDLRHEILKRERKVSLEEEGRKEEKETNLSDCSDVFLVELATNELVSDVLDDGLHQLVVDAR